MNAALLLNRMKRILNILLILLIPFLSNAQLSNVDSLKSILKSAPDGPLRFGAARYIYFYYQELNRDSALFYAELELLIAQRNQNKIGIGVALVNKGYQLIGFGKYADALNCLQLAFGIAEDVETEKTVQWDDYFLTPFHGNTRLLLLSYAHHIYGLLMVNTQNLEQQIYHFKLALKIGKEINYLPRVQLAYLNLGQSYLTANKPDSALYYEMEAERLALQPNNGIFSYLGAKSFLGTAEMHLGDIYKALRNDSMSLIYFYKGLLTTTENNNRMTLIGICFRLFSYHFQRKDKDSAKYYALKNLEIFQTIGKIAGLQINLGSVYENIYLSYKINNQFDSAFKYQGLALVVKDSLAKVRITNLAEFQKLTYNEQLRLQNLEKEKVIYENKVRTYFMLAGIGFLLLLAIIFYRNNRQKQKSNTLLETTIHNLKSTQAQLIQSEKMASLGELTSGIAHEIQNPLNFVNNFSDVNRELLLDLKDEAGKGNIEEVNKIAIDVINNEEKINHHGKRADAIVKGMLQHSRSRTGAKELTDINALADEYLRLTYHGFRAKDNSFNATIKTDLDNAVRKINIIPQDIGRVLLNLYNNAFYTVGERRKTEGADFEPTVSLTTKKSVDHVSISIGDNGHGINQKVIAKIFQPFFTTKPTGQGTGLGLSLSYDIIKAHGGEIRVFSIENEGSEFTIQLPIS